MSTQQQNVYSSNNGSGPSSDDVPSAQTQAYILPALLVSIIAFLMNLLQVIALCRRSPKLQNHIPRLLLAFMGMCCCTPNFWYVAIITNSQRDHIFLQSRDLCFFIPSGLLLFPLLGVGAILNHDSLRDYLTSSSNKANITKKSVICTSCFAGLVAVLPACGWNSWQGYCCLPHVWSRSYVLFASLIYSLHVVFNILIITRSILVKHKQSQSVSPGINIEVLSSPGKTLIRKNKSIILEITALALQVGTTLPIIFYAGNVKLKNMKATSFDCTADVQATLFVLIFSAFAALLPILNLIMDVEIRETTFAVFQPLWNLIPEEEQKKTNTSFLPLSLLKLKASKQSPQEKKEAENIEIPEANELK